MQGRSEVQGAGSGDGTTPELVLRYETREDLSAGFERELLHGAAFVSTPEPPEAGADVRLAIELPFREERIVFAARVVAPRPAPLAEVAPGVSLQLEIAPDELRRQLERAADVTLPEPDPTPPGKTPRAPRFQAVAPVRIVVDGEPLHGRTANLSYNGMLALVQGAELANGTRLALRIERAADEEALELDGIVANQTPCDGGVQALGVHFVYDLDRFNEVSHFVDTLRGLHHAHELAALSGSLDEVPLETVLQTVAGGSTEGTLVLQRRGEEGRIAYREGVILHATTGLETGERALARLFCWGDARFELRPEAIVPDGESQPMPIDSALLVAAVERDELARLDMDGLDPDTVFEVDEALHAALAESLDPVSAELVANAAIGFPLVTLLDMAEASDTQVYKAISELVDAGVLRQTSD